jgi:hypothetical protein
MRNRRWTWLLDAALIFLFAAVLIRPYWKLKYTDNWGSIESTFIADARMLRDHWPRPLWQPFWYVGTRFDYVYPPALRYGTAALAKYYPMDPAKAYHLYTGFFYCFGIAAVYVLARVGFRRREAGWAAGLMAAVVSPAYPFFPAVMADGFRVGTSKLNALVRYGEGPHMTALAWLPIALAFSWLSIRRGSKAWGVAAGVASTMVVANNFYGATALAMFYPFLVWALWLETRETRILWRSLMPPTIAYGLSAFWLTPEYLEITLRNMQYVSDRGNLWSRWIALAAIVAFFSVSNRMDRKRKLDPWQVFLAGSTLLFTLNSVGNQWLNFRIIGEPMRLVPELDIIYILLLVGLGLWLWQSRGRWGRAVTVLSVIAILALHFKYLRHHRAIFPAPTDYKPSLYFKIPDWIYTHYPNSRTYVTGAVRFWYNTWHDLLQLGGSSEQGLQNQIVMPSQWEIVMGEDPKVAVPWMQVLGVDLVATHGKKSKEWYHDFLYPNKFEGALPAVYDDGEENRIYEVPRRYRSLARIVDRAAFDKLPQIRNQFDKESLDQHVRVLEQGPDAPTKTAWRGTDALRVEAKVGAGQSLIVQVTHDVQWRAISNLGPLAIRADLLGFMRIDPPPGVEWVDLEFTKPLSKTVGEILFLLTLLACGWILWQETRKQSA